MLFKRPLARLQLGKSVAVLLFLIGLLLCTKYYAGLQKRTFGAIGETTETWTLEKPYTGMSAQVRNVDVQNASRSHRQQCFRRPCAG